MSHPLETVKTSLDGFAVTDHDAAFGLLSEACAYTNVPLGTVRGPESALTVWGDYFDMATRPRIHEREL